MFGKKKKSQFYSLDDILEKNADYNIIFGERSNGKTYATLLYGLQNYIRTGKQMAYIRRWREDLIGKRGESLFNNHVANGVVKKLTNGKYNEIFYFSRKWFLSYYDEETGKRKPDVTPFCYGFALSEQEHEKSSSYPDITTIVFDEFLTRRYYLPDEFMLFMNMLSTIIRQRDDIKIFMLGNTVNRFCPYFTELGLRKAADMQQGTIDIYKFGEKGCVVAVEYCDTLVKEKASNKYFCFDNQNLEMITGGKWEVAVYPHLPCKYRPCDVLMIYYIVFHDNILQGNIIQKGTDIFMYIHRKSTPVPDETERLIYTLEPSSRPNVKRKLISAASDIESRISAFFSREKVFYQDNEVGELVRNYIMVTAKSNITFGI